MRVSYFCFIAAICAALVGMSLGIVMGIRQDFSLAPAHAHLNLLGWVTMALFGLYHRGVERPSERLAWIQVCTGAVGFVLMAGGLAIYLGLGLDRVIPMVIIGSLLCLTSMILFLFIVVGDLARASKDRRTEARSQPIPKLA